MTEPLIWTSEGNVPISQLTHQVAWDFQDSYVKFTERYLNDRGEVVKESHHVYDRLGVSGAGLAASIGG